MNSVIIIPTLKPDDKIIRLVKDLKKEEFDKIVVVDDGSGKDYSSIFESLEKLGCKVTHREVNKGKGEGIKTGIKFANKEFKDFVGYITVDGDYQHLPCDVKKVALKMEEDDTKIVLGERNFKEKNVPPKSKIGNGFSTLFFRLQTGVYVEDTQTGLRGIPFRYRKFALGIEGSRYEYEMNVLMEMSGRSVPIKEVWIETVYLNDNSSSHFNAIKDAFRIYKEILKYSASSFMCFLADYGLFCALSLLTGSAVYSNIIARICSSLLNFGVNRKFVFCSETRFSSSALKYFCLAAVVLLLNTLILRALAGIGISAYVAKLMTELILFAFSYIMQQKFVFRKAKAAV